MKVWMGTRVFLRLQFEGQTRVQEMILAEIFEPEYMFQLICISGYDAGHIEGFIKKKEDRQERSLTIDELLEALKAHFGEHLIAVEKVIDRQEQWQWTNPEC